MSGLADRPVLGRRGLTAGLIAVPLLPVLAACSGDDVVDLPGLPPLGPDPDEPLLEAALDAERTMVAQLLAARDHKVPRAALRRAEQAHDAHVALLSKAAGRENDGSSSVVGPGGRRSPRTVLEELARREQRLAAAHVERAMQARSGPFARLMAVLAAAATQQSVVLGQVAADLPKGRP